MQEHLQVWRQRKKSPWRINTTLLYAFSLFTVLPCLIMFKQHCTGLWQHRELSCSAAAFLWPSWMAASTWHHPFKSKQRGLNVVCWQKSALSFDLHASPFGERRKKTRTREVLFGLNYSMLNPFAVHLLFNQLVTLRCAVFLHLYQLQSIRKISQKRPLLIFLRFFVIRIVWGACLGCIQGLF